MKVYIFGTGRYYQLYKNYFKKTDIIALFDNNTAKTGNIIDGHVVEKFDINHLGIFDYIYILIRKYLPVKEQLIDMGVPENKICSWRSGLVKLKYEYNMCKKYYSSTLENIPPKSVLLISHDLSYSGAPLALLSLGRVLLRNGYNVVMASPVDNKQFREYIMNLGIDVVIDGNLAIGNLEDISWVKEFQYVVVNTALMYYLLSAINSEQKVLWWLHECSQTYNEIRDSIGIDKYCMNKISKNNIDIYSVGPVAEHCLKMLHEFTNIKYLLYGLDDFYINTKILRNDKIVAMIGSNIHVKGIDLFVKIAEMLKSRQYIGVRFVAVVSNAECIQREFDNEYSCKCNVQFIENMEHDLLKLFYREIFALMVPSRMDVMPIVAAEAFMNHIPVLISSAAGTAQYIEEGVNGFVCDPGNLQEWTDKLQYLIYNPDKAEEIGHAGRQIYENIFSMDVFEKNVLRIFDN